jgi:hypothetical protein
MSQFLCAEGRCVCLRLMSSIATFISEGVLMRLHEQAMEGEESALSLSITLSHG